MKNPLILIIMLLIINLSYAIEPAEKKQEKSDNYYNLQNTLAYSILKYAPDYPVLYSSEIIAEAKDRFNIVKPILISITTNLLIRSYFNIGYDSQLIYGMLAFLMCEGLLTLCKPVVVDDILFNLALLFQIPTEAFMSLCAIADCCSIIPFAQNNCILTSILLIICPITIYKLYRNLQSIINIINLPASEVQHSSRLTLLNKLVKLNKPMFLYSELNIFSSSKNDKYFIRIHKWMAMHKNDISLYNLYYTNDNHLMEKSEFAIDEKIATKINNYHFVTTEKRNYLNLKLGLGFERQPCKELINQADIANILTQQGNFIIEANKDIEKFSILQDLLKDKHQYIAVVNFKSSHYLLISFQVTSNSVITKLVNKLFWHILFKKIPLNDYMTLTIKFKNTQEVMDVIADIVASFEDCNSRMGVYRLNNLFKEA